MILPLRGPAAPPLEKYLIVEPAVPPVVVNPLMDADFAPWDQYQMAYWNRYRKDLFRVSAAPSATWSYGNGVSDMVAGQSAGRRLPGAGAPEPRRRPGRGGRRD